LSSAVHAEDQRGNSAVEAFTVTVAGAEHQLEALQHSVESASWIDPRLGRQLLDKLLDSSRRLANDQPTPARQSLREFILKTAPTTIQCLVELMPPEYGSTIQFAGHQAGNLARCNASNA
jgi:hypothetical protein